jgi:hypothetical protein
MTLTVADVSQAVPATLKSAVTQQFVDTINNVVADPEVAEQVRNNFITYASVLRDGKYKMQDYLNAVTYTSFKMMDMSNHDAWCSTFPQRYQALVAAGKSKKDISSHVSMYAKGKLVAAVAEASFIPIWILNRDIQQKAINQLADKMMNAASEKVQVEAAGLLLTHLAKPKESGPLVNINMTESSGMNEMKEMLEKMAEQQQTLLRNGATTKEIAGQRIFESVQ